MARNVETAEGWEPRAFDCFSPAAIAGIGTLPDTLVDRSVRIKLRRKRREEAVQSLRLDRMGDFEMLSRQAARWAHDNRQPVADADPDMPSALYNRVADNWRPLIADAAGGEWAQRARRAAEAAAAEDGDESARTMLLADLRGLFDAEASGVLFTKEILEALSKRDDRPWPEWGKAAKPITGRQLGMLLNPLGIDTNKTVRRGEKTGKGYSRDKLEDAFARYLTAVQSVTRSQLNEAAALSNIPSVTRQPYVTDTISENTSVLAGCDRVTDREPVCAEEEVEWTA